jgi:hypothetical protein
MELIVYPLRGNIAGIVDFLQCCNRYAVYLNIRLLIAGLSACRQDR